MSRSHRKTPICGMTTAASDKAFKKTEHKRARRAVNARDLELDDAPRRHAQAHVLCAHDA